MPAPSSVRSGPRLPLVVTNDQDLLDDLLRLAAAGGTDVDVAPDPAAARSRFGGAPLVVIGADQADACLRARLPRRPRMVIVGRSPAVEAAWDIAELLGAEHVAVLPTAEPWLVDRFAERPDQANPGRVMAVIGGRGGAGASILAGGLAVTAVGAGLRTLLVDADPLGGGLDLVLGWEQVDGLRWPALVGAGGRVDPPALLKALPHRGDLVLLSFDREVPGSGIGGTRVPDDLGSLDGGAGVGSFGGAPPTAWPPDEGADLGRGLRSDLGSFPGGPALGSGGVHNSGSVSGSGSVPGPSSLPGAVPTDGSWPAPESDSWPFAGGSASGSWPSAHAGASSGSWPEAGPGSGSSSGLRFGADSAACGPVTSVPGEAMAATLDAARRGRDVIIVDVPRRLDEAAILALQAADRTILVVPAELRATAAAARIAARVGPHCADLAVVVRGPAPGRLKSREVAKALGLPLAGSLRPEPALCAALERGEAPTANSRGPLAELCRRLIGDLTSGRRTEAAA